MSHSCLHRFRSCCRCTFVVTYTIDWSWFSVHAHDPALVLRKQQTNGGVVDLTVEIVAALYPWLTALDLTHCTRILEQSLQVEQNFL